VHIGSPTQSPGRHKTGNTQVSPVSVQFVLLEQLLPPIWHVPSAQFADVVHEMPEPAHRLVQPASV
jgi:hypothetical protein